MSKNGNGAITWHTETRRLGDLVPWEHNPRLIKKEQAARLLESLETFGQIHAIAVGPENQIYDGHQRDAVWAASNKYGPAYEVDVRVSNRALTDKERAKLVVYLHKGTAGEFDFDALANLPEVDLADLTAWGFDESELVGFGGDEGGDADADVDLDQAAELNKKWKVKTGDLWLIGKHRLICGDSTRDEDMNRLMVSEKAQLCFTDPPYGVDYDGGTTVREKLKGDDTTALYQPCCQFAADFTDDQAALYLWHAGVKGIAAAAAAAAAAAGYVIRCEIVWNKNQAQFGALSAQYKQKHEPCYYCYKKGHTARWFGPTNEVTVWDVDRASVNEHHPTQKPIELAMRAMRNSSEPGDIVLDGFLGSGATMVASENLGRQCFGLEINSGYCAVILERMTIAFPGIKIEREIAAPTGKSRNGKSQPIAS